MARASASDVSPTASTADATPAGDDQLDTLDSFSRLLEDNCACLDADSVYRLTTRVRQELAGIQAEIDDSRRRLRQAILKERQEMQQTRSGSNAAVNASHATALATGCPEIVGNIERTIDVAQSKVQMYLAKVEQIEHKYDIQMVPKDAFIRHFTAARTMHGALT